MSLLDSQCSCRKLIGASTAHGGPVVSTGTNRGTPAPRRFKGAPLSGTPPPKASRIPRRGRPTGLDAASLLRHPCAITHQGILIPGGEGVSPVCTTTGDPRSEEHTSE